MYIMVRVDRGSYSPSSIVLMMAVLAFLTECFLLCGATFCLWIFIRRRMTKTNLDKIPGPPPASFLRGLSACISDAGPRALVDVLQ